MTNQQYVLTMTNKSFKKIQKKVYGTAEEILWELINRDMFDNEGFIDNYGISFWNYEDEDGNELKGYSELNDLSDEDIKSIVYYNCSYDYDYEWEVEDNE